MKKKILSALLVSAGLAAVASTAQASDGTITFNGAVIASTCKVNGGNGDVTVTLPHVGSNTLAAAGAVAGRTPFTLSLSGCATGTGNPAKVGAFFEAGANVNQSTGRLTLDAGTADAPGAKNVELNVLNAQQQPIKVGFQGDQNSQIVDIGSDGTATLNYFTEYYATDAAVAGAANSRVQYSLMYP